MLTEGCSNTATSLPSHPITRYHSSIPLVRLVLSCQVNSSLKIGLETRAMRYSVSDVASSCATRSKTRKICAPPSLKGRASVNILNSKFRTVKQRNFPHNVRTRRWRRRSLQPESLLCSIQYTVLFRVRVGGSFVGTRTLPAGQ